MKRFWLTAALVLSCLGAMDAVAFACSCGAISTFQQNVQRAPLVVVGQVASVGELPPGPSAPPGITIVKPPFMGAGVWLAVSSVVKGELVGQRIRVWDLADGDCGNSLRGLDTATTMVAALWPVSRTPDSVRETWGAASTIPESDYMASGACGPSVQIVTAEDAAAWSRRRVP